jgi:hypothetical protein
VGALAEDLLFAIARRCPWLTRQARAALHEAERRLARLGAGIARNLDEEPGGRPPPH